MEKKEFLPKEINKLLEDGNVEELKKVFTKCDPNALCSRAYKVKGSNIFSLSPLPREFAVWAKELGADVNFLDGCGFTPIFDHAAAARGDVQLLIDLGAKTDIIMYDGTTPLHEAAVHGRINAMKVLLENGAKVDAGMGMIWGTALESAIRQNQIPFDILLEVCTLLLEHGAQITDRARHSIQVAGARVRKAAKKGKSPELTEQQLAALDGLYELLQADASEKVDSKGNVPLYTIREMFQKNYFKQFDLLWKYLVPENGKASTAQGEVIRIIGRIEHEILDNGSMNWDEDFRKMLHMLLQYFRMGDPLPSKVYDDVENCVNVISDCGEGERELWYLHYCGVGWVQQNSQLILPLPADYSR